jgi:hypothetical protein
MDLDCDRPPPPSADMKSSDSDASELLREFLRKRDMIYLFLSSRVDYSRRRSARLVVGFNAISIEGKCTSFLFFANDYLSLSGLGFPKEELSDLSQKISNLSPSLSKK